MKKIFAFILVLFVLSGLVACTASDNNENEFEKGIQYKVEFWTTDRVYNGFEFSPYEFLKVDYDGNDEPNITATFSEDIMTLSVVEVNVIPSVGKDFAMAWELEEDVIETFITEYKFKITENKNGIISAQVLPEYSFSLSYSGNSAEQYKKICLDWELNYKEYCLNEAQTSQEKDRIEADYQSKVKMYNGEKTQRTLDPCDLKIELSVDDSKKCLYLNAMEFNRIYTDESGSATFEHQNGTLIKKEVTHVTTEEGEIENNKYVYYYDAEGKYCIKYEVNDYQVEYKREFYPDGSIKKIYEQDMVTEYFEDGGYKYTWFNEGEIFSEDIYDSHGNCISSFSAEMDFNYKTEYEYDKYGEVIHEIKYSNGKKVREFEKKLFDCKGVFFRDNYLMVFNALWDEEGNLQEYEKNDYEIYENGEIKKIISFYPNGKEKSLTEFNEKGKTLLHIYYNEDGTVREKRVYNYVSDYEHECTTYTEHEGNLVLKSEYTQFKEQKTGVSFIIKEKTYHLNGNLAREIICNENRERVLRAEYNEDGTVKSYEKYEREYSSDEKKLTLTARNENNDIIKIEKYDRVEKTGEFLRTSYVLYYSNGNIKETAEYFGNYNDDSFNYKYEVLKFVKKYQEDGKPISEIEYFKNETVKNEKKYDENGNLKSDIVYYENGEMKSEIYYYENGNKESEILYYESGRDKTRIFYYENGKEETREELDENGESIAFYKDGERYW